MTDASEDCWVRDLVTIEVEDGQDNSIPGRIQEFVRVPGSCKRPGFRFAVAYDRCNDQIRVVEGSSISMRQGIPQLTAFVDGSRCLRCNMARDPSGKRELFEQ